MRKFVLTLGLIGLLLSVSVGSALATTYLYFHPIDQLYDVGDTLTYDIYADIDPEDAIMGYCIIHPVSRNISIHYPINNDG